MKLFARESGQGEPIVILHGLFGSSDNWYTLAKIFAINYKVYLVDQRNHGQSPHSDVFNYTVMTEDLNEFFIDHNLDQAIVIGHSMGGKTAMNFAVKYPEKVKKLIIVDITPRAYPLRHEYIINGFKSIDLASLESRTQADEILSRYVSEKDERQFLLKNLSRTTDGKFEWKPDVDAISKNIGEVGAEMQFPGIYTGPSLFIRGAKSNYYKPDDEAIILTLFPKAKFSSIDSGHWVQAEKPQEFAKAVLDFLKDSMSKIGKLYLIPNTIADGNQQKVIPAQVKESLATITHFVVEDVRTARRYLSSLRIFESIEALNFQVLNKDTKSNELAELLKPLQESHDIGVISESGCPGVADPGALAVEYAHQHDIQVVPLVGPSSILLALMASGLNGQKFAFHGYLPIDTNEISKAIKTLESESRSKNQTQIFIETPYRNHSLLDHLLKHLHPNTKLSIAIDITGAAESIQTKEIKAWASHKPSLSKTPTVFSFLAS